MPLISQQPGSRPARGAIAPGWLLEVIRLRRDAIPWPQMLHAVLAICVPLAVGLGTGKIVYGVLLGIGGLLSVVAAPSGPLRVRVARIALAGVLGGAPGLLIGTLIHGRGWATVVALMAVAGVSALASVFGASGSAVGLQLLIYACFALGPLGSLRPWWLTPLLFLAGVAWGIVLLLPAWLLSGHAVEQRQVADVYRSVARKLRSIGTGGFADQRRAVTAALNTAYDGLLAARSAAIGREPYQAWLMGLLNHALMLTEATTALTNEGRRPSPADADAIDALAGAIQYGGQAPAIPDAAAQPSPGTVALHDGLAGAAELVARGPEDPDTSAVGIRRRTGAGRQAAGRGVLLAGAAERLRGAPAVAVFAVRLMLCIGVAVVISDVLPLQRSYWVVLTVAIVLRPDFGSVFARALQRGIGTVAGAVLGAAVLALVAYGPLLLIPLAVCAFLLPYGRSRNYGMFSTFQTPLVVLLVDLLARGGWPLAEERLIDTLVGCGIVLLAGYAPWPGSWYSHLPASFAAATDGVAACLEEALAGTSGAAGASGAAGVSGAAGNWRRPRRRMYRTLSDLRTQFQRTLAEPAGVRRRATTWWPAVIALEQVMDQVTAVAVGTAHGAPRPSAAAVHGLAGELRSIAAAARSGRPPPAPAVQQYAARDDPLNAVAEAVRGVQSALAGERSPAPER